MTVLMARPQVIWHGTGQEGLELCEAIARNCTCEFGLMGIKLRNCAPHDLLVHSQEWLDHLLELRRCRDSKAFTEFPGEPLPPEDYP